MDFKKVNRRNILHIFKFQEISDRGRYSKWPPECPKIS